MTYTADELLVAAKVLELAGAMATRKRHEAWNAWRNACATAPSKEESDAKHAELAQAHPTDAFLAPAMGKLKSTVDTLKTMRDQTQ